MQRRSRDDEALARVYGKRAALGICTVVAVWFAAVSVAQIMPAVFGAGIKPLAGGAGSPERQCAEGLRATGGPFQAETATDPGASEALARVCAESPAGLDAWAALGRLRTAEEQLKGSDPAAIAELKRQLSAHLPAEMR